MDNAMNIFDATDMLLLIIIFIFAVLGIFLSLNLFIRKAEEIMQENLINEEEAPKAKRKKAHEK